MRASSGLLLTVVLVAIAPACGSSVCISGAQVSCACPDGSHGAQVCNADGNGFEACRCGSTTSSTTSSASTTSAGTGGNGGAGGNGSGATGPGGSTGTVGSGGGTFCAPNTHISCYSGPPVTLGVGLCVAGVTECKPDGSSYGPCLGEVTPKPETCSTPGDDDCNGMANEGGADCSCVPNMQSACYSGPPATQGVGPCHGGMQLCKPDGTGFGSCVGEVAPAPETCTTPIDDDCDGMVNEDGVGCVCAPSSSAPCYDGPMGTQNVGICKPGTHACNDQGTAYGPCMGQVLPSMDLCVTPADEDCNGLPMPCVGGQLWSKKFGEANVQAGWTLAADASGNVVAGGQFVGSINFGGGALVSAAGSTDAWLAKFDSLGNHIWSKKFGDAATQSTNAVQVDPAGNVLITGYFGGSADFGGGTLFSAGGNDIFVAKFDPAGNHIWSKQFGDNQNQGGNVLATDASGNVIVTGFCGGSLDFGLGSLPGDGEFFLAKLDANGSTLWAKRFGVSGKGQTSTDVRTDGLGNIVLVGQFDTSLDFGGGALVSPGGLDVFVAKFSPSGNHLWSKRFGSLYAQQCGGAAVDAAGNIALTGRFIGSIDFGGGALSVPNVDETDNIFVAKLDPAGNHLWSKQFGDGMKQVGSHLATGPGGTLYVTGSIQGSANFGGGVLTSAVGSDIFLAKFDANGNHLASQLFGGAGYEYTGAIAPDGAGGLFITGLFDTTIDFGTGLLTSAGGDDIFLARLSP